MGQGQGPGEPPGRRDLREDSRAIHTGKGTQQGQTRSEQSQAQRNNAPGPSTQHADPRGTLQETNQEKLKVRRRTWKGARSLSRPQKRDMQHAAGSHRSMAATAAGREAPGVSMKDPDPKEDPTTDAAGQKSKNDRRKIAPQNNAPFRPLREGRGDPQNPREPKGEGTT